MTSERADVAVGRVAIPVRPVAERSGKVVDDWYALGPNDFAHPDGTGIGRGSVHLKMVYTPFHNMRTSTSSIGAVMVTVIRCRDLVAMDRGGTSDPYVKLKLNNTVRKTHVVNASCEPEFHVNFEFFDVPITEKLQITVFDRDFATRDDFLGDLEIEMKQLAANVRDSIPGSMRQWFKLQGYDRGEIQLKLQYIPMDDALHFS